MWWCVQQSLLTHDGLRPATTHVGKLIRTFCSCELKQEVVANGRCCCCCRAGGDACIYILIYILAVVVGTQAADRWLRELTDRLFLLARRLLG